MRPFTTTDEAWTALVKQRGMSDGEAVDLWEHQLQTAEGLERLGADEELIVAGLLRQCDDAGKDPTHQVQHPERFRAMLDRVAALAHSPIWR